MKTEQQAVTAALLFFLRLKNTLTVWSSNRMCIYLIIQWNTSFFCFVITWYFSSHYKTLNITLFKTKKQIHLVFTWNKNRKEKKQTRISIYVDFFFVFCFLSFLLIKPIKITFFFIYSGMQIISWMCWLIVVSTLTVHTLSTVIYRKNWNTWRTNEWLLLSYIPEHKKLLCTLKELFYSGS